MRGRHKFTGKPRGRPPIANRPRCIYCDRPLRAELEGSRGSRIRTGQFGWMGEGQFHAGTCAQNYGRWAARMIAYGSPLAFNKEHDRISAQLRNNSPGPSSSSSPDPPHRRQVTPGGEISAAG